MTPSSLIIGAGAVVLGLGGAILAYDVATPDPQGSDAAEVTPATSESGGAGEPRTRFRPCTPPAVLEGGVCVTDVVRTVVVSDPPASASTRSSVSATEPGRGGGHADEHCADDRDHDDCDHDRHDLADEREDAAEDRAEAREEVAEERAEQREEAAEDRAEAREEAREEREDEREDD